MKRGLKALLVCCLVLLVVEIVAVVCIISVTNSERTSCHYNQLIDQNSCNIIQQWSDFDLDESTEESINIVDESKESEEQKDEFKHITPPAKEKFMYKGVLSDNQFNYTYYSSRVLRHKDMDKWSPDECGYYRTSEGYLVVASDDYPLNKIIDTELFGKCKVLDCGVGESGYLDVYVNW